MTPKIFLAEVAQPNMQAALERPGDLRAAVNAILTLDALPGIIHAYASAAGRATIAAHEDDLYRDELARNCRSYQVLRDAAASIKHGELSPRRKKVRLVTDAGAFRSVRNQFGLFQFGDSIGGSLVIIQFDPGPGFARASSVIADSFRLLESIIVGEADAPQTTNLQVAPDNPIAADLPSA